ncbi:Putidaredoxin [Zhongshania aliphaticivorans]|uniref:Putidaredoxin n=1 Tax=Zhongshania aliphaticivorans TaxID=1470434 RepID=A0A5S9QIE7_9GAMM|nr:2Fe-2S iron-sulfur cluster-binding protein [Zhongshania aliphaticivorans]CAA0111240.1 Putidaredoxin [Zhongshania aliphaticivorans]CAA0118526.1 Putidaredoxin [Zhongshania aliphaticivorans]
MVKVTFVSVDGRVIEAECEAGRTLMECATDNMIAEIEAQCGGGCACGTCHCYPREEWLKKIPAMDDLEECTLEGGMAEVKPTSRLACQIILTEEMSGLVVDLPELM